MAATFDSRVKAHSRGGLAGRNRALGVVALALIGLLVPSVSASGAGEKIDELYLVTHEQPFVPEGRLAVAARSQQRATLQAATEQLEQEVTGSGGTVERSYVTVPTVAARMEPEAASRLAARPEVREVRPVRVLRPSLDAAVEQVRADDLSLTGIEPLPDGSNVAVAVLDTGVDRDHAFFADDGGSRVVTEACFSSGGDCPGGGVSAFGSGAAAPLAGNGHGTHVAGIAGGARSPGVDPSRGLAPAADIIAVQIFSEDALGLYASEVDLLSALEWLVVQADERRIAAVNLSLGSDAIWAGNCDLGSSATRTVIDALRERGVLTVAAAGNDGHRSGQSWPACLSNVVGVAAVDSGDGYASFTNVSSVTDLAAPGVGVRSSVPGGAYASYQGTSMAAPVVSGAATVLASQFPDVTADDLQDALRTSSTRLDDDRLDGVRTDLPRLDVRASLDVLSTAHGEPAPLGTPTMAVQPGDLRAAVSWTEVDGADRYQLFRSTSSTCTTGSTLRYEGSGRAHSDAGLEHGRSYSYCVRAVDGAGAAPLSTKTVITAVDLSSPPAPRLRARAAMDQIELSWDAVPDATGPVSYRVFRSAGSSCTSGNTRVYSGTARSVVDAGLVAGTTYRYCATASDAAGNRSVLSQVLRVTTSSPPAAPRWPGSATLRFEVIDRGVSLSWPAPDGSGPLVYEVRYDGKLVSVTTSRQAAVRPLSAGSTYLLEVRARDSLGQRSAPLRRSISVPRGFVDIGGSIFGSDIAWLATAGVTRGCNPPANDRFCPSAAVTREQMAAFLVRSLGLTAESGVRFQDVPRGSVFERDIDRLATAGITRGCNPPANDRFCPSDPVTREQMAAFLVRGWGLQATSSAGSFTDVSGSGVFSADINRLATAGITRGCDPPANSRYCPTRDVTREQMAAFLRRAPD